MDYYAQHWNNSENIISEYWVYHDIQSISFREYQIVTDFMYVFACLGVWQQE